MRPSVPPTTEEPRPVHVFTSREEIDAVAGDQLGSSAWLTLTQERVDRFADATGDHQWIHTDPQRAEDGPFGGTIAHGYLTLSLLPSLRAEVLRFETGRPTVNYGLDKVRFPHPVRVGSRVRAHVTISEVRDVPSGVQVGVDHRVEIEGVVKPACLAQAIVLLV